MKHFYLYKITNKINGKIYIGVHETENLNDGYMGSGSILKLAKEKHGLSNFDKEIIEWFDTADKMYLREKELVTEEFISDRSNYNKKPGGIGGSVKGIKRTPEQNAARKLFMIGKNSGKVHTAETIAKRIANRPKIAPSGWTHSEEANIAKSIRQKGKIPKTLECPHCNKIGKGSAMYRHHFDRCKEKQNE